MAQVVGPIFLYEDAGPPGNFGPHALLCACVADKTGISPRDSRLSDARPLKGNGNVLKACWDKKFADVTHLVAVLDSDKIRELPMLTKAGVHKGSTDKQIVDVIRARAPIGKRLQICLLEKNAETLVRAVLSCEGRPVTIEKDRNNRDIVLNRAAWSDRRTRDCVLNAVPSFARVGPGRCLAGPGCASSVDDGASTYGGGLVFGPRTPPTLRDSSTSCTFVRCCRGKGRFVLAFQLDSCGHAHGLN